MEQGINMVEKLPIIILNYNSSADCRKCVKFLQDQQGIKTEVIIVDNCSRPEERLAVDTMCKEYGATFLPVSENRGYNAGNNVGLRYAAEKGYEYALVANPDMEFPHPDYLAALVEKMSTMPEVVVMGSDIMSLEGEHQNPKKRGRDDWRKSFNWVGELFALRKKGQIPVWVENPHKSQFCSALNGCCLLLRLSFAKSIGFFDEHTFLYGEEPILGRQVELAGKKMYYFAEVQAIHAHVKSKEGSRAFCYKHWKHSRLYYVRAYSGFGFFGKAVAMLSIHLYFAALYAKEIIKKVRRER